MEGTIQLLHTCLPFVKSCRLLVFKPNWNDTWQDWRIHQQKLVVKKGAKLGEGKEPLAFEVYRAICK
jgi:hypothetical protein